MLCHLLYGVYLHLPLSVELANFPYFSYLVHVGSGLESELRSALSRLPLHPKWMGQVDDEGGVIVPTPDPSHGPNSFQV